MEAHWDYYSDSYNGDVGYDEEEDMVVGKLSSNVTGGNGAVKANFTQSAEAKPVKKVVVLKNVEGWGRPASDTAVFCTRHKFPELWNDKAAEYAEALKAEPAVAAVLDLPGVISARSFNTSSLYDLTVRKATAYDWSEIEPIVVRLLEARHDRLEAVNADAQD